MIMCQAVGKFDSYVCHVSFEIVFCIVCSFYTTMPTLNYAEEDNRDYSGNGKIKIYLRLVQRYNIPYLFER